MELSSIILPVLFSFLFYIIKSGSLAELVRTAFQGSNGYGPWSYEHGNIGAYSARGTAGNKATIEDRFNMVFDRDNGQQKLLGFAVYDGHGGEAVSAYLEQHFLISIIKRLQSSSSTSDKDIKTMIEEEFENMDQNEYMSRPEITRIGSTAVVGLVHNNKLYIAHVGDSRAVTSKSLLLLWSNIWSTTDHTPKLKEEHRRILALPRGVVKTNPLDRYKTLRVQGKLSVSRAIGDAFLKPYMIATPDISVFDLSQSGPKYMIMASDGLWDGLKNDEVLKYVSQSVNEKGLLTVAEELAEMGVKKMRRDDTTVVIVNYGRQDEGISSVTREQSIRPQNVDEVIVNEN